MRDVLARLLLALLVLASSAGASPLASLTPSAASDGTGVVRAGDEAHVAPFEAAGAPGVRIAAPRVVAIPLPTPTWSRTAPPAQVAPSDLRARALRTSPHRRIHRVHAPRAPDEH